jgi:hypothetical protein
MELVDVTLTELTRRSRTLRVAHSSTALGRGLELGESLLVRDDTGFYSAIVGDLEFELDDTVYVLALGARVPEELAEEKLAGRAPAHDDGSLSLHDVIDLLGTMQTGRVPEPRKPGSVAQTRSGVRTKL